MGFGQPSSDIVKIDTAGVFIDGKRMIYLSCGIFIPTLFRTKSELNDLIDFIKKYYPEKTDIIKQLH